MIIVDPYYYIVIEANTINMRIVKVQHSACCRGFETQLFMYARYTIH